MRQLEMHNPSTFTGVVEKVQKNYLPQDEGREGGENACSAPAEACAWTQDLPRARQESPAAHHEIV